MTRTPILRLALSSLLTAPLAAQALEIVVTKTTDSYDGICDSDCSLREAVALAGSVAGEHLIRLPAGSFQLSLMPMRAPDWGMAYDEDFSLNGDLDVYNSLRIIGAGKDQTIILGRLDRIFEVMPGARLQLERMTLTGGASPEGGAIKNRGSLQLTHMVLTGNRAYEDSHRGGGAVLNLGDMTVQHSEFIANNSVSHGGAIRNEGLLVARDVLFKDNRIGSDYFLTMGGAIFNGGVADINRSLIVGNMANFGFVTGSAVANFGSGQMQLANSTLSNNWTDWGRTGDVIANGADEMAPVSGQRPRLRLVHVTVADNVAAYGLRNYGDIDIRNSLILGTRANEYGGLPPPPPIIAQNCHNVGPNALWRAHGLLLGTDSGNCMADLPRVDDAQMFTQVLHPLAANGSTLPTHALRPGSPAIDAGVGSCASHDQRRVSRPRDGNGDGVVQCDLGAYERVSP